MYLYLLSYLQLLLLYHSPWLSAYLLLLGILTGISIYHNLGVFVDAFGQ